MQPLAAVQKQLAAVQTLAERLQENHDDIVQASFLGTVKPPTAATLSSTNRHLLKQLKSIEKELPE
eukprot:604901-Rhodomonas_salina.1